jgi:chromosome segregation ATPase
MSAIRKDVNVGLLLLIVAALLMFSGFTVYYQSTFKNVSQSFDIKLKELDTVSGELASKRNELNDTSIQLSLRKQKEEDLSKKFTDVRDERDSLESIKAKLELDLASTQGELSSKTNQLSQVQSDLDDKKEQILDLNAKIITLNKKVNNLDDEVDKLRDEKNCWKDKANGEDISC